MDANEEGFNLPADLPFPLSPASGWLGNVHCSLPHKHVPGGTCHSGSHNNARNQWIPAEHLTMKSSAFGCWLAKVYPTSYPTCKHKLVKLCVCKRLTRNILKRVNYVKGVHILSIYIYRKRGRRGCCADAYFTHRAQKMRKKCKNELW